jgi:hypothetical protein
MTSQWRQCLACCTKISNFRFPRQGNLIIQRAGEDRYLYTLLHYIDNNRLRLKSFYLALGNLELFKATTVVKMLFISKLKYPGRWPRVLQVLVLSRIPNRAIFWCHSKVHLHIIIQYTLFVNSVPFPIN